MSEKLKNEERSIERTEWDDLADVDFAGESQDAQERLELEAATKEKLNGNSKAKKALTRAIIAAAASLALLGGVYGATKKQNADNYAVETERRSEMEQCDIRGSIANLDKFFESDDEDEIIWTQNIALVSGPEDVDRIPIPDESSSQAGQINMGLEITDENIDEIDLDKIGGRAKQVNISWQKARGDVYTVIDKDGDGYWDEMAKFSPETGESKAIGGLELEHEYSRYDMPMEEPSDETEILYDSDGFPMPPISDTPLQTLSFLTADDVEERLAD